METSSSSSSSTTKKEIIYTDFEKGIIISFVVFGVLLLIGLIIAGLAFKQAKKNSSSEGFNLPGTNSVFNTLTAGNITNSGTTKTDILAVTDMLTSKNIETNIINTDEMIAEDIKTNLLRTTQLVSDSALISGSIQSNVIQTNQLTALQEIRSQGNVLSRLLYPAMCAVYNCITPIPIEDSNPTLIIPSSSPYIGSPSLVGPITIGTTITLYISGSLVIAVETSATVNTFLLQDGISRILRNFSTGILEVGESSYEIKAQYTLQFNMDWTTQIQCIKNGIVEKIEYTTIASDLQGTDADFLCQFEFADENNSYFVRTSKLFIEFPAST